MARLYLLEGKFESAQKWAQDLMDSGQADETARKMLEAAQAKQLSDDLRKVIEPLVAQPSGHSSATNKPLNLSATNATEKVQGQKPRSDEEHNANLRLTEQPPVVVETYPHSGAQDIVAGETEIRVRFSKPMSDGSWSWSTAWENSTPESMGKPHYLEDHRTCVMKVLLEPGRTYAWWLNSERFKNFKDIAGQPAVPYLLTFQTKSN